MITRTMRSLRYVTRTIAALAVLSLAVAAPSGGQAQQPPSLEALRARLETLRQARPAEVPIGAIESIAHQLDVVERIAPRFGPQERQWRERATRLLATAEGGADPFPLEGGKIISRGYISPLSTTRQGYTVYIPRNYDPSRSYPLMIVLHGGSSNGNLFLGVVLGNNMSWLQYPKFLWDNFQPKWSPDWIVVSPDGFGQVLWRWMGEADVLDVIDDVQRNYNVDPDQIVLSGLSNGGIGAHNIGMRHAWRFSTVMAMAGAPSWLDYAGGGPRRDERLAMSVLSGRELRQNAFNTDYRIYHGLTDTGPMRPSFIHNYEQILREDDIPFSIKWYDLGHDILYPAHQHGRIYESLAPKKRNPNPESVTVSSGDYRAARQHWVTISRFTQYPELGLAKAKATSGRIEVTTNNVSALSLDLREAPIGDGPTLTVSVDGTDAWTGLRESAGHILNLAKTPTWHAGFPDDGERLVKQATLSGPITDAYYGMMIHVYGTQDPAATEKLRQSAERGAKGWPLWLWFYKQPAIADTAVTPEMMRTSHLVLYGTPAQNSVLGRIADRLPIKIESDAVLVGAERITGRNVGVKFIYPNPLQNDRYVIVQSGTSLAAINAGHNLPDFLPDYIVYDAEMYNSRPRLLAGVRKQRRVGYFDANWQIDAAVTGQGGDDSSRGANAGTTSALRVPAAPPTPAAPASFAAPKNDPAGRQARKIAERVQTFANYRAQIAGARWQLAPDAVWQIRSERACLADLREKRVPFRRAAQPSTPVATPVELTGKLRGIHVWSMKENEPVILACEMVARLYSVAEVFTRHGVTRIDVISSYRDHPYPSFHTLGLALDISRVWTSTGPLNVLRDFEMTPSEETCAATHSNETTPEARALRSLACDLADSRLLSSVLTPNYNEGHRNHFHIDARPDDPRLFVR